MFVLASLVACNGEPTSDLGTVSETPGGDFQVSYTDVGVACVRSADTGVEVNIDFGDCYACSAPENDFACEITVEADTIVVHAGGSVVIRNNCKEEDEGPCTNTTAFCSILEGVAEGAYILSYGGIDIPVGVPDGEWVCTGPTDVL